MREHARGRGKAASLCLALLLLSAGCGELRGTEPLAFTASNASIDAGTLAGTNYTLEAAENATVERSIELQGETRTLLITSHVSTYTAEYRGAPPGQAVLLATPRAGAFGRGLNPLGTVPREDLLDRAAGRVGNLTDLDRVDNRTIRTLGGDATVTRYAATATREGTTAEVYVLLLRVSHDDDYVIATVAYPRGLDAGLAEALALLRNIEH